jgi:hypothetical protein
MERYAQPMGVRFDEGRKSSESDPIPRMITEDLSTDPPKYRPTVKTLSNPVELKRLKETLEPYGESLKRQYHRLEKTDPHPNETNNQREKPPGIAENPEGRQRPNSDKKRA